MAAQNPLDGDVLILLADYYSEAGNFEKAEFLYERAQSIAQYEAKALYHYGKALIGQTKYREAIRSLERAQDIDPQDLVEEYLIAARNVYRAVR